MTNDEICNLAVEYDAMSGDVGDLLMFARAIEIRARLAAIGHWLQEGKKVEREACAAICDAEMDDWGYGNIASVALNNVAAEIRARGE